jgi:dolichyl-phosphate beta-glucosyltransferase
MMPSHSHAPVLSVVIPAYNEAGRIVPYLANITGYFGRRRRAYEILVVDDGSMDETVLRVEQFRTDEPAVRLMTLPTNTGKGAAVRTGMMEARGDLCLLADADGATPIQEVERLEGRIQRGADIAVGSRFLASQDSRFQVRAQWHRTVLGNLLNRIVQRMGIEKIADTQCGFKLLRRGVARDLFSVARVNGYGFDLELLYVAQRRGYQIDEVPINWNDQPGSKVRVLRDGIQMVRELLSVRQRYDHGDYAQSEMVHLITSHQTQALT